MTEKPQEVKKKRRLLCNVYLEDSGMTEIKFAKFDDDFVITSRIFRRVLQSMRVRYRQYQKTFRKLYRVEERKREDAERRRLQDSENSGGTADSGDRVASETGRGESD